MSSIETYLRQFASERLIYLPNPGNAGDSVIAAATYQLFDRLALSYETPRFGRFDPLQRVVVYGGGGNLVGPSTFSARVACALHHRAKRFIILPHTIKDVDQLLESFGPNVDVICREQHSFAYVSSHATRANVLRMDDMAFSLSPDAILTATAKFSGIAELAHFAKEKLFGRENIPGLANVLRASNVSRARRALEVLQHSSRLYCLRTDGERTDIAIPADNVDLSKVFAFGVETKPVATLATREVLRFLSRFDEIHTNRLHMAISAALLGKAVKFYPNSYFKCRAVYDYSMRDKFSNVSWVAAENH